VETIVKTPVKNNVCTVKSEYRPYGQNLCKKWRKNILWIYK